MEDESASCSTQAVVEEPALRPAALRALRMGRTLTDGEQSLTAESVLSADIESIDTDMPETQPISSRPYLPPRRRKVPLQQPAEPQSSGLDDADSAPPQPQQHSLEPFCDKAVRHSTASAALGVTPGLDARVAELAALRDTQDGFSGGSSYSSFSADPDFSALLQDIAAFPVHGNDACPTSEEAASAALPTDKAAGQPQQPSSEAPQPEPQLPADSAPSESASQRKSALGRLRPNPFRGFLSRRRPSQPETKKDEGPQNPAVEQPPTNTSEPTPDYPQPESPPSAQPEANALPLPAIEEPVIAPAPAEQPSLPASSGAARTEVRTSAEDRDNIVSMAINWLRATYSGPHASGEALSMEDAFDRIADLLPGVLPHENRYITHALLLLFPCSDNIFCIKLLHTSHRFLYTVARLDSYKHMLMPRVVRLKCLLCVLRSGA